jgi:uncharacterized membrane protein required for colicin V production
LTPLTTLGIMPGRRRRRPNLVNFVDLIFGLVIVLAMARGWYRGLLATIATYTAPVLGFMIAADMSDPVRDWLAVTVEAPDIALDVLAPLLVFIVVVAIVRFIAAILARLLGVGRSVPGRVLGAGASAAVIALLLGAGVLMVDEVSPLGGRAAREGGTQLPEQGTDPLADLVMDIDRQIDESLLAPQLASLASSAWSKVSGKSGDAAETVSQEMDAARNRAAEAMQREAAAAVQKQAADAVRGDAAPAADAAPAQPAAPSGKPPGSDPAR